MVRVKIGIGRRSVFGLLGSDRPVDGLDCGRDGVVLGVNGCPQSVGFGQG